MSDDAAMTVREIFKRKYGVDYPHLGAVNPGPDGKPWEWCAFEAQNELIDMLAAKVFGEQLD